MNMCVRSEWPALAAIAATLAVGCAWVGLMTNVPVIDDWVYAWSVEHLLKAGRLQVLEYSAIYPVAQILWGALFARVAGFSFGVLRISTVVLSTVGCWAFYLTLRELGCRRSASLIGALALALDPVYFAMSFSFMTDVPFVSLSTIALFYYLSAIRRGQPARLWIGALASVAAFLVRPIGIVLPLAVVPTLDWRGGHRSIARELSPLITALVTMGVLWVVMPRAIGSLDWSTIRGQQLRWWFLVPWTDYLSWNVRLVFESVFPFLPLLLASVVRRRRALVTGALALVLMVALRLTLGTVPSPLPDWQTWSLQDIGARAMVGGDLAPSAWSLRATPALCLIGILVVAAMLAAAGRACLQAWRTDRSAQVMLALGILHLGLINLLWLYNDRYYLVLAPTVAYVGVGALETETHGKWVAAALLIAWAVIGASGTRDMLAVNDACATAARQLEATGVPPWEIDAGYSVNGWRLYAHPEHLPPGANRRFDVPHVTSDRLTIFMVANKPLPGFDVVRVVPLEHAWWQVTNSLYVLRRRSPGS